MSDFYLTLPSDSSMDLFSDNTQCAFKVKLPHTLVIPKQQWEVALVEMIIPSEAINLSDNENTFEVKITNSNLMNKIVVLPHLVTHALQDEYGYFIFPMTIPVGNYSNPKHLIEQIKEVFDGYFKDVFATHNMDSSFAYGTPSKRTKIYLPEGVAIRFNDSLYKRLGGDPHYSSRFFSNGKTFFKYTVDMNMDFNHLYVYSDIVEYNVLGDITAPILRVVPFKRSDGKHSHHEFLNLHYLPVARSEMDTISVHIRGDTGRLVQFTGGKSMVKLHFRRTR